MSGKHDKSVDDEQSRNLLLTGPIAIRGLGRGMKEALLPGRPSRHRSFVAAGPEGDVDPTPLQEMLAAGPTVADPGPSSDLAEHARTQAGDAGGTSFPSGDEVPQTGADGSEEDRVDDRADDAPPADDEVAQSREDEPESSDGAVHDDGAARAETVDDWIVAADHPDQDPALPSTDADQSLDVEPVLETADGVLATDAEGATADAEPQSDAEVEPDLATGDAPAAKIDGSDDRSAADDAVHGSEGVEDESPEAPGTSEPEATEVEQGEGLDVSMPAADSGEPTEEEQSR